MTDVSKSRGWASLHPEGRSVPLSALVDRWVADGTISTEQADHMLQAGERLVQVRPVPRRTSLVTEALAYLGGVIVVVGVQGVVGWYWDDLGTGARVAIVGAAYLLLLGGGITVTDRFGEPGARVRSVLWLAATVTMAGLLSLVGSEVLDLADDDTLLLVSAGAALSAATLWALHRVVLLQVAMMLALGAAVAATIADLVTTDSLPGLGVWAVGVIWILLGWGRMLAPARAALALGAALALLGAMVTTGYDAGIVLALATAAGVVLLAVVDRDLILLAVGAIGTLMALPAALSRWFPDTLAAPVGLLVVGLLLTAAALWTARRHAGTGTTGSVDVATGRPMVALFAIGVVLLAVIATVVGVALG